MKFLTLLCALWIMGNAQAQKAKLTIEFTWSGIEEGYDHLVKDQIFIDGVLVRTT